MVIAARLVSSPVDNGTKPRTMASGRYGMAIVTAINVIVDHRRTVPGLLR